MKQTGIRALLLVGCLVVQLVHADASAQQVPPESVGLSSARLMRVEELMQRHIAANTFSGSVTLVARDSQVA